MELNIINLDKLEQGFKEINEYNLFKEARDVYYFLNNLLSGNLTGIDSGSVNKFKALKAKFGFICIFTLPEKDIFHLYNYYLGVALSIPYYDLWDNLKKYLISFANYNDRDETKKKIINIIVKSKSIITKNSLMLGEVKVFGTAENWFRDYNGYVGSLAPVDKLKFEQYFIDSQNFRKLSEEEKNKIKNLFIFYEKLKLSSMTPEGFEEDVPIVINSKLRIWKDGNLEDIDPSVEKTIIDLERQGVFKEDEKEIRIKELNSMLTQYPPNSLERKAIEEEIKRMNTES